MIDYLLLDVFTDLAFTGNPLAVVLDADELSDAAMATVANELNLSETVFLGSPDAEGAWPTRIFTPAVELPFAGHPSVGAAIALAHVGRIGSDGSCVLAERVGDVAVEVTERPGASYARFAVPRLPHSVGPIEPERAAELAGVTLADLSDVVGPAEWSAGVGFAIVTLRDIGCVARATPSHDAEHVYVVAPVDGTPAAASTWRARLFAPAMGIVEDPATGSAASAFAGVLADLDDTGVPQRSWTVEQGVEMGRPSRIDVTVSREDARVASVHIGGSAVVIGHGSIEHP